VSTLQRLRQTLRVGEQLTQGLPDERVELLGRTLTGLTALVMLGVDWVDGTATPIIARPVFRRSRDACCLTHPATDQGPQYIVMRSVVARGPLFIERQVGLDPVAHLLADEPRHVRTIRPCLGRGGGRAMGWFAQRMGGGAPDTSRTCAGPSDREFAGLGRIRQQAV